LILAWFALDLHFPAVLDPHWPARTPADELKQRGFGRDRHYSIIVSVEPKPNNHPSQFKNVSDRSAEFWKCIEDATQSNNSRIEPRYWVTLISGGFWRYQIMDIHFDENGNGYFLRGDSRRKYYFHSPSLHDFAQKLWENTQIAVHDAR
jgi:hypothetical protein